MGCRRLAEGPEVDGWPCLVELAIEGAVLHLHPRPADHHAVSDYRVEPVRQPEAVPLDAQPNGIRRVGVAVGEGRLPPRTVLLEEEGYASRHALVTDAPEPVGVCWPSTGARLSAGNDPVDHVGGPEEGVGAQRLGSDGVDAEDVDRLQQRLRRDETDHRRDLKQQRQPLVGGALVLDGDPRPHAGGPSMLSGVGQHDVGPLRGQHPDVVGHVIGTEEPVQRVPEATTGLDQVRPVFEDVAGRAEENAEGSTCA